MNFWWLFGRKNDIIEVRNDRATRYWKTLPWYLFDTYLS